MCRVMSNCQLNVHWMPYVPQCGLCDHNYTAVGRLETMQEDLHFIGEMAGFKLNTISANPSSGGSTSKLARKYFGQLKRKEVKQLYELYRMDFQMFGYSPWIYFNTAGKQRV